MTKSKKITEEITETHPVDTYRPGPRTTHDRQKFGEHPDPTPVEIPGKCQMPLSLRDDMRRFIREELTKQALKDTEIESFEESNDFEIENPEDEIITPYTVHELAPEPEQPIDDLEGTSSPEDRVPEAPEAEGETQPKAEASTTPLTSS